jgi:hypothetical protein
MKDNFSAQAATYAQFRPDYPDSLVSFLLTHTANHDAAWDCGTGNGQLALKLASYFRTVYATDTIGGRIVTLLPGASALTAFAASEEMRGIDGIAVGGNGDLYINNVQRNLLQRVERSDGDFSGLTTLVTTLPLSGPDGLRSIGGNRFLQAEGNGGRVALLTVDGDKVDMQTIVSGLDYPAAVTLVGKVAFVSEGKIGYLIDPAKRGQDPGTFTIHAVEFE